MTGYYDIVLGLIPLSLAGLTALLLAAGMSLSVSLPLASTVAIGLMGHAMFVNAPLGATKPDVGTQATGNATPPASEPISAD